MKKITVVGGGISGLTAAWYASKLPHTKVTLFEKTDRLGGWIETVHKKGYLFEMGPRSLRPFGTGLATLKLIQELGLENEILLPSEDAKRRFLYLNQQLYRLPNSPLDLIKLPWLWKYLPTVLKEPFVKKNVHEDESIDSFFTRRFSKSFTRTFIDPMVSGVYAGSSSELSIKCCFPTLHEWEVQHGSLLLGAFRSKPIQTDDPFIRYVQQAPLFTLRNGMETLVNAIAEKIDAEIVLNTEAPDNKESIRLNCHPKVPKASVTVVSLGFKENVIPQKGFGYLIPRTEKTDILGCIWDSSIFPEQEGSTRLTVMISGKKRSEKESLDLALEHLKIPLIPEVVHCKISKNAIPQYPPGYPKNGSYVSVNDCIDQAAKTIHSQISG